MGKSKELWLLDVQENEVFLMDCNSFTDCRRFGDDTLSEAVILKNKNIGHNVSVSYLKILLKNPKESVAWIQ